MATYKRFDYLEVVGYSHSNFAKCVDTRKSIFGYVFALTRRAISWKSIK